MSDICVQHFVKIVKYLETETIHNLICEIFFKLVKCSRGVRFCDYPASIDLSSRGADVPERKASEVFVQQSSTCAWCANNLNGRRQVDRQELN